MKIGNNMVMELKKSWKGLLIFLIIVLLLIAGFIQAYPSVRAGFEEDLEGQENIEMEIIDENRNVTVKLTWDGWHEKEEVNNYTVLMSNTESFTVPMEKWENIDSPYIEISLEKVEGEVPERYFAVAWEEEERKLVGIESTVDRLEVFQEIWGADITDIRGMISMLWDMWWVLLIGLYLGYVSVNSVAKDFEERRMDIIFSKPISRKQYILEKFTVLSLFMFVLLVITGLVMIGSVGSVGELNTVSSTALFLSTVLSLPIFLVIIAFSILGVVHFKNSKKAIGFSFLIILFQFGLNIVADIAEGLEYLGTYTILSYWDHEAMLVDEVYSMTDIGLIFGLALVILGLTIWLFEKKDIPV